MTRRKMIKGEQNVRLIEAKFLRVCRSLFRKNFRDGGIKFINDLTRQARKFRIDAICARPTEGIADWSKTRTAYMQKLERKLDAYQNALIVDGEIPLNDEFVYALSQKGISAETANNVLEILEETIRNNQNHFIRDNKRPAKRDFYFNAPLCQLLMKNGLRRKQAARIVAKIRTRAHVMTSPTEDVDKLTLRIEQQIRNLNN